jgi:sucrose-6-phosphate hydrolase SacC (GH32 family)
MEEGHMRAPRTGLPGLTLLVLVVLTAAGCTSGSEIPDNDAGVPSGTASQAPERHDDANRPVAHYTPSKNWMNDPNGLVWYDGEYHLFYQYNPEGTSWGNMSWGHAVSRDLVHWQELPVAIPYSEQEHIFSGSVVVDEANTSGFGTEAEPPLVAMYTSVDPDTGVQSQALAYSNDRGRTWTKHEGNPVLDIGSTEFRDPKVFWYDEGGYWVMSAVLAEQHVVKFYRSDDLRSWTHLSDFGPANAVGGVWEMPDLFPLPVDGDPNDTRWVLMVSLNPGGISGGSGVQYFVGDFDGRRFVAANTGRAPTPGEPFASFDGDDYGPWAAEGTAFGEGPVAGAQPGQHPVDGFEGRGLASSFGGDDAATGRLVSPEFSLDSGYVNLLVGGGHHPRDPGASRPQPGETAVNLVVDGEVVRSASGADSESLDWVAWNVTALRGKRAHIEVVDEGSGPWGHISVDEIAFGDAPARPRMETYDWADYGKDFYAAVSYNNVPGDERVVMGWMSNWEYAEATPSTPWRGAMTVPRRLELRTIRGEVRLTQEPVQQLSSLRGTPTLRWTDRDLPAGVQPLPDRARGEALEIRARFDVRTARRVGLHLRTGGGHQTVVGYDADTERVYVDRTDSGAAVDETFPGRHEAPLEASRGTVLLRIVLDRSSVEVFAGRGEAVITDQIFPEPDADGLALFAEGGTVEVESLEVTPLAD